MRIIKTREAQVVIPVILQAGVVDNYHEKIAVRTGRLKLNSNSKK